MYSLKSFLLGSCQPFHVVLCRPTARIYSNTRRITKKCCETRGEPKQPRRKPSPCMSALFRVRFRACQDQRDTCKHSSLQQQQQHKRCNEETELKALTSNEKRHTEQRHQRRFFQAVLALQVSTRNFNSSSKKASQPAQQIEDVTSWHSNNEKPRPSARIVRQTGADRDR